MCYSAQVSLDTFLLGLFASYFIYNKYKIWEFYFWLSFINIQLMEYFLWKNLHHTQLNHLFSILTMLLILSQPFLSIMASNLKHKQSWKAFYVMFAIYMAVMCVMTNPFKTVKAPNGHLLWKWSVLPFWIVILWAVFLIVPLWHRDRMTGLFTTITFIVSLYTYYSTQTWQSMWCWMSTIASFYIIWNGIYHCKS